MTPTNDQPAALPNPYDLPNLEELSEVVRRLRLIRAHLIEMDRAYRSPLDDSTPPSSNEDRMDFLIRGSALGLLWREELSRLGNFCAPLPDDIPDSGYSVIERTIPTARSLNVQDKAEELAQAIGLASPEPRAPVKPTEAPALEEFAEGWAWLNTMGHARFDPRVGDYFIQVGRGSDVELTDEPAIDLLWRGVLPLEVAQGMSDRQALWARSCVMTGIRERDARCR